MTKSNRSLRAEETIEIKMDQSVSLQDKLETMESAYGVIKRLEFIRMSEKSWIYYEGNRVRTYLCSECNAICTSTLDHTKWHNDILSLIQNAISGEKDLSKLMYQPVVSNPLVSKKGEQVTISLKKD